MLSICNTGVSKSVKCKEIMNLGDALQYVGTKSLLLNSWEVSDKVTPELMKYFYDNIKKA
ncbi:CHAT domain-containing protein [Aquimarina sp. MMG016]|nr:CHAT domain-containing protein [Aquimarina sp. MMG016]